MATPKVVKLKEDARRKLLEESIFAIQASLEKLQEQQVQMLEMLRKIGPHQGLKRRVK